MTDELVSLPGLRRLLDDLGSDCDVNEIPVEVAASDGVPLWRVDTIRRFVDIGGRDLPMSPSLVVLGVPAVAERLGVSVAAVRKWRLEGRIAPTWEVMTLDSVAGRPSLYWAPEDVHRLLPECNWCRRPVEVGNTQRVNGGRTYLECECGKSGWLPLVIPVSA